MRCCGQQTIATLWVKRTQVEAVYNNALKLLQGFRKIELVRVAYPIRTFNLINASRIKFL